MRKEITIMAVLLAVVLSFVPAGVRAAEEAQSTKAELFVGTVENNADKPDGSREKPYPTLSYAVTAAPDGAVIRVLNDLEVEECARYYDKNLTITSADSNSPVTLTRVAGFRAQQDKARGAYNPAMIEVQGTEKTCGLILEYITLDDAGRHEGQEFSQAVSGGESDNTSCVQDAMIASNATVPAQIVLGPGTVLRNYGGMSAVRVTDHAELVMECGSLIEDTTVTDRGKEKGTGPAGAVWVQGSKATLKDGAMIENIVGRGIYADGGEIYMGGQILNVSPDTEMWQGTAGYIVHLRNGAMGTLTGTAVVDGSDITEEVGGNAIYVEACKLAVDHGAIMRDLPKGTTCIASVGAADIYMDGEITGMRGGNHPNAMNLQMDDFKCIIGPNGFIHHNESWYGTIYAQGKNGHLDIYGKINDNLSTNRGGGVTLANNFGPTYATLHEGGEICRNTSTKTGAGVMVCTGTFTMKGGIISGNVAMSDGGGVYIRKGGSFVMEGGTIADNVTAGTGGGVHYMATDALGLTPVVQLKAGKIEGNRMGACITEDDTGIHVSEGIINDVAVSSSEHGKADRYISIHSQAELGNSDVWMDKHNFGLCINSAVAQFGNASAESERTLQTAAANLGWKDQLLASFWISSDCPGLEVVLSDVKGITETLPVYALMLKVDEMGNPISDATLRCCSIENFQMTLDIPGENGYVVGVVQPTEDYGELSISALRKIRSNKEAESYDVEYTVNYLVSDNLKNVIGDSIVRYQLHLAPDVKLTGQPDVSGFDGQSITVSYILPADNFVDKERLLTTALLSIEVDENIYTVPTKQAVTVLEAPPQYTAFFDAAGGKLAEGTQPTLSLEEGNLIPTPADPIREGYTFIAWNEGDAAYDFSEPIMADTKLTAVWKPEEKPDAGGDTPSGGNGGHSSYYDIQIKNEGNGAVSVDHIRAGAGTKITVETEGMVDSLRVETGTGRLIDAADKGNGQYTFIMPYADVTVMVQFKEDTITDPDDSGVSDRLNTEDHLAYLHGFDTGYFCPAENMTRAQAAQMFFNLLRDSDSKGTATFTDVPNDAWYAEAVHTLAEQKIILGVGGGRFEPERDITRAEFTVIAMRFADLRPQRQNIFSDVREEDWFYEQVTGAIRYGWINGYEDGTFRPYSFITRAEVTTITNRMLGRRPDLKYLECNPEELRLFPDIENGFWAWSEIVEATNGHSYEGTAWNERWIRLWQ